MYTNDLNAPFPSEAITLLLKQDKHLCVVGLQLRVATALWHGNTFAHCFTAWKDHVHSQRDKTARTSKVKLQSCQQS